MINDGKSEWSIEGKQKLNRKQAFDNSKFPQKFSNALIYLESPPL